MKQGSIEVIHRAISPSSVKLHLGVFNRKGLWKRFSEEESALAQSTIYMHAWHTLYVDLQEMKPGRSFGTNISRAPDNVQWQNVISLHTDLNRLLSPQHSLCVWLTAHWSIFVHLHIRKNLYCTAEIPLGIMISRVCNARWLCKMHSVGQHYPSAYNSYF